MMPRKKMVPRKEKTSTFPSYFMCMKKNRTKEALKEAMIRAIHTFRLPRSIKDAPIVIPVKANNAKRTLKRVLYSKKCKGWVFFMIYLLNNQIK
jgi:hypothetical protein